ASLVLPQNANDLFVRETCALHSLVLSMGQSLLQNGLFQRGKVNLDAQISTMRTANTFYARAASRGLQRSIVGADRTDECLRMAWMGEIKALCQYTATIDVSPEQGNGKTMVVYARNLPVQSPLFVSERWLGQIERRSDATI
ncbi:hypothetical protein, partial [Rhizobium wenxiniae]|uniref:hypothetical protein n=1 Tax=Rhizobium wenxiniae TaxID=1737357 RepID=UPI001C6F4507